VARTGARSALTSLYVRDPDGNLIELSKEEAPNG
jgi:catechol 2,3-dioxygenase-like lactoylglutathione lyase family enzyme